MKHSSELQVPTAAASLSRIAVVGIVWRCASLRNCRRCARCAMGHPVRCRCTCVRRIMKDAGRWSSVRSALCRRPLVASSALSAGLILHRTEWYACMSCSTVTSSISAAKTNATCEKVRSSAMPFCFQRSVPSAWNVLSAEPGYTLSVPIIGSLTPARTARGSRHRSAKQHHPRFWVTS